MIQSLQSLTEAVTEAIASFIDIYIARLKNFREDVSTIKEDVSTIIEQLSTIEEHLSTIIKEHLSTIKEDSEETKSLGTNTAAQYATSTTNN